MSAAEKLDKFLYDNPRPEPTPWSLRYACLDCGCTGAWSYQSEPSERRCWQCRGKNTQTR